MNTDTPTNPIRALAKKENSALTAIVCVLLTGLGALSGIVWSNISSTVTDHSRQISDQQTKIAVLETQRQAIADALAHIEMKLDAFINHQGKTP